jgi:two-component system, LuxR family, response regulator FixJ
MPCPKDRDQRGNWLKPLSRRLNRAANSLLCKISSITSILMIIYQMQGTLTHLRKKFTSTAPTVEPALPPKSSGNNVLVVDDDNAVCQIVQRMLSNEQYQVQTSQSVADALQAIEQKTFDAYVMDCRLPDGSGLDVAERIRSKGSEAPIILISGYDASSVASRAEKFRIFDFLQKPFSQDMICNAVKKAIGLPKGVLA